MAVARNARRIDVYPELREALIAYEERFQETFPVKSRAERIEHLKSGGRLEAVAANVLWSVAFGANLPIAEELFLACYEQLMFEFTEDNELNFLEVDTSLDKPAGKPNRFRTAANTRWTHRR